MIRELNDHPWAEDVLVKMRREDYHVIIQTYDRTHGLSAPYRIHCTLLKRALENDPSTYHRSDDNFLTMRRQGDRLQCGIVWLTRNDGRLCGFEQRFDISVYDIEDIADGTRDRLQRVSSFQRISLHISTGAAAESIRNALKTRQTRRALIRAMRDIHRCFTVSDDDVYLTSIGGCNFAFDALQSYPPCGQLRLRKEADGKCQYMLHGSGLKPGGEPIR